MKNKAIEIKVSKDEVRKQVRQQKRKITELGDTAEGSSQKTSQMEHVKEVTGSKGRTHRSN